MYYGTKSYQKKLNIDVSTSLSFGLPGVMSVAFSGSYRYRKEEENEKKKKNIYLEDVTTCNLGSARYNIDLAPSKGYQLTDTFLAAGCKLTPKSPVSAYVAFITSWGTHVINKVQFGTKKVKKVTTTMVSIMNMALKEKGGGMSVGGSYQGFGGSFAVDVNNFKQSKDFSQSINKKAESFARGTSSKPEPIHITIEGIQSAFQPFFWKNAPCKPSASTLKAIQSKLKDATNAYVKQVGGKKPSEDKNNLKIEVTWEKLQGPFVLPDTNAGCPGGNDKWSRGTRTQVTGKGNIFPKQNFWPINALSKGMIIQSFCTSRASNGALNWPRGSYCIIRASSVKCPEGFEDGSITWDDKGSAAQSKDKKFKNLPAGDFGKNTKIEYCCRNDGNTATEVILPNEKPFFLLAKVNACQSVKQMKVTPIDVTWDEQTMWNKSDRQGNFPFDSSVNTRGKNHQLRYCYYK